MRNDGQSERELLRDALGPKSDCPPLEALVHMLRDTPPPSLVKHVGACAHCRTELELLRGFEAAEVRPEEERAVREVAERLRSRSQEIFGRPPAKPAGWKAWLTPRRYGAAGLAFAAAVGILAVGLQLRHDGPPALGPIPGSADVVMRSHSVAVLAPVGDLQKAPEQILWQAATGAVKYEVRLMEVDQAEIWKSETSETSIALPAAVQARIVPSKTILCQVIALDASGRKAAESELVRFRVLQNVYSR